MTAATPQFEQVPGVGGVWRYEERGCSSYVLVDGGNALAIDASGSGLWKALETCGAVADAALVTHPEEENVRGLRDCAVRVLAPVPAGRYLSPAAWEAWKRRSAGLGIWDNYDMPRGPLDAVEYVLAPGGIDFRWRSFRIQTLATPGHTPAAMTFLVHWHGKLLAFCGDAVAKGGTLRNPHHLEWDHWTAEGARAAAAGLDRLTRAIPDVLLPSHGGPILEQCDKTLRTASRRLRMWIEAKEGPASGTRVAWLDGEIIADDVVKIAPGLYQAGVNGYAIAGSSHEAVVVDPGAGEWEPFQAALKDAGATRIHAILATHYHLDHAGGIEEFRRRSGAGIWLTQPVADILREPSNHDLPFRPPALLKGPERILEFDEPVRWDDFRISAWDFPGQTRAHAAFLFQKPDISILFSGDNFFPPERWNGTGGCSVANRTCPEYYARSARRVIAKRPDWICAGHRAPFAFAKPYFERVVQWATEYREAIERLQHPDDRSGYREITGTCDFPEAASRSRL